MKNSLQEEIRDAELQRCKLETTPLPTLPGLTLAFEGENSCGESAVVADAIPLDHDETAIVVIIAEGRTIPAAYATAVAKLSFRHHLKPDAAPAAVLAAVNDDLASHIAPEVYFKAFLGIIDLRTNTLRYSNAGINDVKIMRPTAPEEQLNTLGGHLGLLPNWSYEEKSITVEPSDALSLPFSGRRFVCKVNGPARKQLYLKETGLTELPEMQIKTLHNFDQMKSLIRDLMGETDRIGYSIKFQKNFRLVLLELLTNAIIHGNRYDTTKKVVVLFSVQTDSISIGVIDEGEGYNPDTLPDPLAPENISRPHGRGIFLIRHYTDDLAVKGHGNIAVVRFNRNQNS